VTIRNSQAFTVDAAQLMVRLKARSFPVIGPGRQLVGIISREDVMRALREATQETRRGFRCGWSRQAIDGRARSATE